MKNPFEKLFRRSQADTPSAEVERNNWREEEERWEAGVDKLKTSHPEIASLLTGLQDPDMPKEEFFRRIEEFNDTAQALPAEGAYTEIVTSVSPERKLRVKMFANGRVTISGSDF